MTNIYLAQNSMRSNWQSSMVSKSFAKFTDQNGSLAKVINTTKTYFESQTLWRLSINMKFWCSKRMKNSVEENFDDAHQHVLLETLCCISTRAKHRTQEFIAQNIIHKFPSLKTSHTNIHRSKNHMQASMAQCFGLKCNNSLRRLSNGIFTKFHVKINRIFDQCLWSKTKKKPKQKSIDVSFWVRVYKLFYFDAKWCNAK